MEVKRLFAAYFSATGTTRNVVRTVGQTLGELLNLPLKEIDFTLPAAREETHRFLPTDFVLFASPVYAGRIPNVLRPFVQQRFQGENTPCAAIVLYGNRNYDDALLEWKQELTSNGFCLIGGGAFVGEHSFSTVLGGGRPDTSDLQQADKFAHLLAEKIGDCGSGNCIRFPGEHEVGPYYTPRDRNGTAIDIRKVKPKVSAACTNCGKCVACCPMGSIDERDVSRYLGICIKCGACIKGCPVQARYYDDPGYLYHKSELEDVYQERKEPEFWL